MRLRLQLPPTLLRSPSEDAGSEVYILPSPTGEAGPAAVPCRIELLPPLVAIADPAAWLDEQLLQRAPPGTLVTGLRKEALRTESDWPLYVALGLVGRPDPTGDGKLERVEPAVRLVALYRFLDKHAGLLVSCTTPWFEAHRAELLALLSTGTPDWRSPALVALADLWAPG